MQQLSLLLSLAAALGVASGQGLYTSKSPVLQVDAKNYQSLIAQSNHTSIVEFYAPWCGHCKSLQPHYEKAAKALAGLAKVAAVNCDEESNKPFCGQFGVQGFPTLKIVKPSKKPGKPIVEDYRGQRTAKDIVEAVTDKISNHVKRLQDKDVDAWLEQSTKPKAILFTEKATIPAMIKALAIDFLDVIDFAQIRNKEADAVSKFDIDSFPTVLLINEGEQIKYDGAIKKDSLISFLSQAAAPNPDPAPKKAKPSATKKSKTASASKAFSKASEAHKSSDFEDYLEHASTILLTDDMPTESPLPIVDQEKPMVIEEVAPPIPTLSSAAELASSCLTPGSGHCVLLLLPPKAAEDVETSDPATKALVSFAKIADKHQKRKGKLFPFYAIPAENDAAATVRQSLGLSDQTLDVVAVNMKKGHWRQYSAEQYELADVEAFVDSIRFGEGAKQKLPANFFTTTGSDDTSAEHQSADASDAEPLETPAHVHEEL